MKLLRLSNFTLKWDNAPADYGSLFYVSEVISAFDFAVGTLPLSVVVVRRLVIASPPRVILIGQG
jgi:hypothetical protein